MHIVSVRIENYRAISNLKISFADSREKPRPVSVIVGPNGCGKTSILFGITQALRGVFGFQTRDVPDPTRDDIRLPISEHVGWTDKPPEILVEVELQFSDEEQQVIPEVMKRLKKETPPALPDGRLAITWKYPPGFDRDGNKRDWWYADVSPHLPYARSWLTAKAWAIGASRELGSDLVEQLGGFEFFPQDRSLLRRVVGDVSEQLLESEQEKSLDRHGRPVSEILAYLAEYASKRADMMPGEWNREQRIREMFDRICSPKKYVGIKYRDGVGYPVLQDGRHLYPLGNAASGEQIMLEYITRLVYRGQMRHSIILIDEPELHLHPKWIRQLYMALPQIGVDNQFILTTHSDELRRRASADNATIELGSLGDEG